jgi:hypothetical protein
MIGFIIGTACLIGLIATLRRGRWGYGGGCGHHGWRRHHHHHGWGGGGGWGGPWERHEHGDLDRDRGPWARERDERWGGGGGFGRGPRNFILRRLSERLDATPGQEKVLAKAFDEMRDAIGKARSTVKSSRGDVAKAVRSDHFDAVHLGETFSKHDEAIDGVRKAFVGSMQQVHDVLDERQRRILAELIESGPFGFGGFRG